MLCCCTILIFSFAFVTIKFYAGKNSISHYLYMSFQLFSQRRSENRYMKSGAKPNHKKEISAALQAMSNASLNCCNATCVSRGAYIKWTNSVHEWVAYSRRGHLIRGHFEVSWFWMEKVQSVLYVIYKRFETKRGLIQNLVDDWAALYSWGLKHTALL